MTLCRSVQKWPIGQDGLLVGSMWLVRARYSHRFVAVIVRFFPDANPFTLLYIRWQIHRGVFCIQIEGLRCYDFSGYRNFDGLTGLVTLYLPVNGVGARFGSTVIA